MKNETISREQQTAPRTAELLQSCLTCRHSFGYEKFLQKCPDCNGKLEYRIQGNYNGHTYKEYNSLWKYFDLIPLAQRANIVSLGEGNSDIVEFEELNGLLNGARLFVMLDSEKNPTGVFKDREASIVVSRCKEMGLDNLVFYSTANTGRSYTHYAATLGLTTFLFMPEQCHYKNTDFIRKNPNNHIIYVNSSYPRIAPYARKFAEINGLSAIAPIHERNEAYATVAYEQVSKLPHCNYFVQTIASGMGPIGFLKGHENLVKLGLQKADRIPRVICIQSNEMNVMATAYNSGKTTLMDSDLPSTSPARLFEPTLNSTNPVNNFGSLYNCLKRTAGIISDVGEEEVNAGSLAISRAFLKRGLSLRTDLEKSVLIEFAGLLKLAKQNVFKKDEVILMLACGRGKDDSNTLLTPDAVIDVDRNDPSALYKQLISG